jgi:hypothetical protein
VAISIATGNGFLKADAITGGLTISFVNNISAGGSLLVAFMFSSHASDTLSISDSVNGAWTVAVTATDATTPGTLAIAYKFNAAAGNKPSVTGAGYSGSGGYLMTEYLGVQSSSDPLDGVGNAKNVSGSSSVPTVVVSPTGTGDLIAGYAQGASGTITGAGTGYTTESNPSYHYAGQTTWAIDRLSGASPGSQNVLWTPSVTFWLAVAAAFKAAGAAAATGQGFVLPSWNAPGVGPNPARVGRQFAFKGSTFIPATASFVGAPGLSSLPKTGQIPTLTKAFNFSPVVSSLLKTGQAPSLSIGSAFTPSVASLVKTGQIPTLTKGFVFNPIVSSLLKTGQIPTMVRAFNFVPGVSSLVKTGQIPVLAGGIIFSPGTASLLKTGQVPVLSGQFSGAPGLGSLTKTGQVPTLAQSGTGGIGGLRHSWFVKGIGVKTKITTNSQVDSDTGDTP